MSGSATSSPEEKAALYKVGNWLVDNRLWVSLITIAFTAFMAYEASKLQMYTSFGDLLPQNHPFVKVHNKYSQRSAAPTTSRHVRGEGRHHLHQGDAQQDLQDDQRWTSAGVNHNQIDSIGHRTVRYLKVAAGGTHARRAGHAASAADAGRGRRDPPHRPQRREHLRPDRLARRQGGADPRQLHRGPPRLQAHLRRRERQGHRAVRGRQHRRSTSPASRASTAGSTTTPATSSSSSSSPTASSGCCAGCTSTTGAARCVRRSPA